MKGILTIFKKELARFFGDKRMAFTAILMPGLLIYVIYSLMGSSLMDTFEATEDLLPVVAVSGMPASFQAPLEQLELIFVEDGEEARELVAGEAAHAAILFPENFDALVQAYEVGQGDAPQVELIYNTASADSQPAYNALSGMLTAYESSLVNKFDIIEMDAAPEEAQTTQIFAMMLPMLLMTFLYSGCASVAPEAIAGEKERGTIATLLITPVGRSHIAMGKIMALSLIAVLSATSSALGTILSLPKLMGSDIGGNIYGAGDYLLLGAVILSTVLLMVTLISIISAFAKTVKEATTMSTPLMVVVMFLGVMAMSGPTGAGGNIQFLIPLYNSVQTMTRILTFSNAALPTALTAVSNLAYAALGVVLLTKLFRSEKILSTT
ncbi:MAG: ABC transporter permease [Oscillospiraceae bacterium]|nr:ABC transporter permease [Oscillospiraceae bacterium]